MCQHPQNHRQGSVGATQCSCCLSLSQIKIAVVFTTLVPQCACVWLFTKSTSPGAQQKTAREEDLSGTHRCQHQLACWKHVKDRGTWQGWAGWLRIWYKKYFCIYFFKACGKWAVILVGSSIFNYKTNAVQIRLVQSPLHYLSPVPRIWHDPVCRWKKSRRVSHLVTLAVL